MCTDTKNPCRLDPDTVEEIRQMYSEMDETIRKREDTFPPAPEELEGKISEAIKKSRSEKYRKIVSKKKYGHDTR